MNESRAAKDTEMIKAGSGARYGLQRDDTIRTRSAIEDVDCCSHSKFPIGKREARVGEHAESPLGERAPRPLDKTVLMSTVRRRELKTKTKGRNVVVKLMGVENTVVVETKSMKRETIGLGQTMKTTETVDSSSAGGEVDCENDR